MAVLRALDFDRDRESPGVVEPRAAKAGAVERGAVTHCGVGEGENEVWSCFGLQGNAVGVAVGDA